MGKQKQKIRDRRALKPDATKGSERFRVEKGDLKRNVIYKNKREKSG